MQNIKLSLDPPVATITLNRPQVRNAISADLIADFESALDQIENDPGILAVIVTGEGSAFSAGVDLSVLKEMTRQPAELSRQDSLRVMRLYRRLYLFPRAVIAAVNGPAIAGGCGLASICDLVIAAEDAIFGYTELKIGFVPALVSVFLVRICGEKRARELMLTGRTFSAAEALQIGLVTEVVPREQLLSRAHELAESIARNSPTGVAFLKGLVGHMRGAGLDEALTLALEFNALIRSTEDFKEGVTAFLEKRPPRWKIKPDH
ncbi:MAG: enoyl-CoA hydratase/isomerase family protein [Acidobacteria bacterium]|nr:enoyl-CoA hydratase/isomerase family protein [Acidobacteriota bacterium]